MNKDENLFGDYIADKTIKGRVRNPKTWVNLLILIVIIAMVVVLVQSVKGSWSKDEIKNTIKIIAFSSKWVVKSVEFSGEGSKREVSIIPQVTFKIKNIGKRELGYVRLMGNFVYAEKRASSIGDGYSDILKNSSLKPGEISDIINIKSTYGYKTTTSSNETYYDMFFSKKGWKKFNVRISARVKGTVKEIAEFPVDNNIEDNMRKEDNYLSGGLIKSESIFKDIIIDNYKAEWKHVDGVEGNIFIPTITFYLKNSGKNEFEDLKISASFEFDDKKGVIAQWKGKKGLTINSLLSKENSNEMYFEAENGIKASSVKKLFLNRLEWKNVIVKIFIGTKNIKPSLFKTLNVGQKVKGYKVREKVIH